MTSVPFCRVAGAVRFSFYLGHVQLWHKQVGNMSLIPHNNVFYRGILQPAPNPALMMWRGLTLLSVCLSHCAATFMHLTALQVCTSSTMIYLSFHKGWQQFNLISLVTLLGKLPSVQSIYIYYINISIYSSKHRHLQVIKYHPLMSLLSSILL